MLNNRSIVKNIMGSIVCCIIDNNPIRNGPLVQRSLNNGITSYATLSVIGSSIFIVPDSYPIPLTTNAVCVGAILLVVALKCCNLYVFTRVVIVGVLWNFCEGSALLECESRRKDLFYGPVSCERSTGSANYTFIIPVKKQLVPRPPLLPPLWLSV